VSGHLDWRTVRALHEQIEARRDQRVHLTGDRARTGRILGGGHDAAGEPYWTVAWDDTGPDNERYEYRRYTGAELTALPTAPAHRDTPAGEQLSLFGGAP
jgi:hypothetical protein